MCPHISGSSFGGCLSLSIELPCRVGTAPGPLTSLVVNTGGSEPAVWILRAELIGKGVVNRPVSISMQGPFMYRRILLESCQSCLLLRIVLVSPRNALGLFHFWFPGTHTLPRAAVFPLKRECFTCSLWLHSKWTLSTWENVCILEYFAELPCFTIPSIFIVPFHWPLRGGVSTWKRPSVVWVALGHRTSLAGSPCRNLRASSECCLRNQWASR